MHTNDKDIFFKQLKAKLGNYEADEATESDWEQFSLAYKTKKKIGFWNKSLVFIALAIIVVSGLIVSGSGFKEEQNKTTETTEQTINKSTTNFSSSATPQNDLGYEPLDATRTATTTKDERRTVRTNKKESQQRTAPKANVQGEQKPRRELNIEPKGIEVQPQAMIAKADVLMLKAVNEIVHSDNEAPVLLDRKTSSLISIEHHKGTIDNKKPSMATIQFYQPTDSTKYMLSKPKGQQWHIDLSALFVQGVVDNNIPSNKQWLNGASIMVGRSVGDNWKLTTGLEYGVKTVTELVIVKTSNSETEIVRIDTFLKYQPAANRIMMQMDTVTRNNTIETLTPKELYNKQTWLSMPILAGYCIGNEKRKLTLNGGVHAILLTTESTRLTQTKETVELTQARNWLFAPTIGVGVYQRIYKQLGAQMSADYLYYLPNQTTNQQSIQLRAGVRFNF